MNTQLDLIFRNTVNLEVIPFGAVLVVTEAMAGDCLVTGAEFSTLCPSYRLNSLKTVEIVCLALSDHI